MRALPALLLAMTIAGCGAAEDRAAAPPAPADPSAPATASAEPTAAPTPNPKARVQTVATGLEVPWDLAFLPGGDALVTERAGRVRLLVDGRRLREKPVATIRVDAQGEGGLMGLVTDPDFADNGFVYVLLTRFPEVQLLRFTYDERRRTLRGERKLVGGIRAGTIHDSGRIRFGPDGRLYVATGDAGQGELAQDPRSLNGKFLRLTKRQLHGSRAVRPEIFSLGHRNPQGLDFDPRGRLVATEHGPSGGDGPQGFDEVNVVRKGRNYGWPEAFGAQHDGFTAPLRVYEAAVAPSGATFLRRPSAWRGSYLFATLRGQELRRLRIRDGREVTVDEPLLDGRFGRLRAVVEAPDGSIYVTTSNQDGRGDPVATDDRILRLTPPRA